MTRRRRADAVGCTANAYAAHAEDFLLRWGRNKYRQPPLLRALLAQLPRPATLLDLGCGAGQDARDLSARRYRAIGMDLAGPLLRFARERMRRLPLVQADMRVLPLRPRSFDAVWAAASLIHLPRPAVRPLLRELRELVQPGGWLAMTVAHGRRSGVLRAGWISGRYCARWNKDELANVIRASGWEIVSLETVTGRERKGRWLNVIARTPSR